MSKPAPARSKSMRTISGYRDVTAQAEALFSAIDADNSGAIDFKELETYITNVFLNVKGTTADRVFLRTHGITPEMVTNGGLKELFDELDVDSSGTVTLDEFRVAVLIHRTRISTRQEALHAQRATTKAIIGGAAVAALAVGVFMLVRSRK